MPEKEVNKENEPGNRRVFPEEENTFAPAPVYSTRFSEEKTSTPKRPGGTNRIGHLPSFEEASTIYENSPQRAAGSRHPTNCIPPNNASLSDTTLSIRTIGDVTRLNILKDNVDEDLYAALKDMRKKRANPPAKPDFTLKPVTSQRAKQAEIPHVASSTNSTSLHRGDTEAQRTKMTSPATQYVMCIILRRDLQTALKWSSGTVYTQVAHATSAAMWIFRNDPNTDAYTSDLDRMYKVILGVDSEEEIKKVAEKLTTRKLDHKVWIEDDLPVCIALKPYPKEEVKNALKGLKLF